MNGSEQKIFTAEEIHSALILCAVEYMKQWKVGMIDEKELKRNQMLKDLGFTSSKSLKESNKAIAPSNRRMAFDWYSERFPNCIFLKVEDFVSILQKYNLVCGILGAYKGEIPYKNLEEIADTKRLLGMYKNDNPYSNKYTDENTIEQADEFYNAFYKRKFLYSDLEWMGSESITREEYDDLSDKNERYPFYGNLKQFGNTELFIAAPAQDINSRISDFHIKSEDPFVFQLFPFGVVIFSKWGNEADDPILEERKL